MFSLVQPARALAVLCICAVALTACGGGGHHTSSPLPEASPTTVGVVPSSQPTVAASPSGTTNAAAYVCPTSNTASAAARGNSALGEGLRRRMPLRHVETAAATAPAGPQFVAVTYDARVAAAQKTTLAIRESTLGATRVKELVFPRSNLVLHVLSVPAAQVSHVESALRLSAGVRSVGLTGMPRYASSVSEPYWPNDPYFTGFPTTVGGATPTFEIEPLVESADVPGQWDMHVMRLEYAFGYSISGNTLAAAPGALGSPAVKIAIIDTGQDTTHPELKSRFFAQGCFITNPSTGVQSTSAFTTDPDGHGTNIAGVAGAALGNGLGFIGAGGNVQLIGYRVFPTPDDSCANDTAPDGQCTTSTVDIASAISDAVNVQHTNVISLSLGGDPCASPGVDPDPSERTAIADAISQNVIVVAAAGNNGQMKNQAVEAPACDTGVIAVGATALADGAANGSTKAGGSASAPFEYVASYSDYGAPASSAGQPGAWGIVAPGGDPSGDKDPDLLHWIANIWTSAPFDAKFAATSCDGDYPMGSGTADCEVDIAGTSMATPHVAGAAALILSVNSAYQSPTSMRTLLCSTADDIADSHQGCGRLDVYRAMATALSDTAIPAASPIP